MPSVDYELAIYFAPHFPYYLDPLRTEDFVTNFKKCGLFILEYGAQWFKDEPGKETLYNQLSGGFISTVPSKSGRLAPFSRELQGIIQGSGKRIVLERSPVVLPILNKDDVVTVIASDGLDAALAMYKKYNQRQAEAMVRRDCSLLDDILRKELKDDVKVLMFRGSAHFRHMSRLLQTQSIVVNCIRYQKKTPLFVKILGSLTMGESVQDVDFLRLLHAELSTRGNDYDVWIGAHAKAELMTEEQIRVDLLTFGRK